MAAPVDAGRATTNITAAATPWTVNLPGSIASGDLLVMYVQTGNGRSVTATGWTLLVEDATDGSADNHIVLYRVADGTEGATVSVTPTGGTSKGGAIVWRVTGAKTTGTILTSATVVNQNANIDPPNAATDGGASADVLAIVMAGVDGETQTFSAAPASYSNLQTANSGTAGTAATNCVIAGATRQRTAVTAENPGAFTNDAPQTANGGTAYTVLAHASGAAGDTVTAGGAVAQGTGPSPAVAPVAASGALGAGNAPVARATSPQGGATAAGLAASVSVPISAGGATAGGFAPTESSGTSETPTPGGAVAAGDAPTASVTATQGAGLAGGNAPTANATVAQGGAQAAGNTATAFVAVLAGGGLAGGNAPSESTSTSETPTPGGALAGGASPSAVVTATVQGGACGGNSPTGGTVCGIGAATAGGNAATAVVELAAGGATAGGNGPFDSITQVKACVTVWVSPPAVVALANGPMGSVTSSQAAPAVASLTVLECD